MKHILIPLLVLTMLAACAPTPTETPVTLVDNDAPSNGLPPIYAPRPGDDQLLRGEIYLDSVDLLTMESYPLQFALILKGNLPTPCHEIRVVVSESDAENKINLEVYSLADPDAICVQMLQPFEQNIPLGSFPSGHYTVWINGEQVAEFDA